MAFNARSFLAIKQAQYHRKSQGYLRALDALFQRLNQGHTPQLKDGLTYAKLVLLWCFVRFEVHLAAFVIFLLVLNTSMFLPLGSTDIFTRLSVVSASMLLGTSISFSLIFLVLPLHIWRGISLWGIAAYHTVLSALVVCTIEPFLVGMFHGETAPGFSDIFVPVLLLFGLTDAFVLWQTQKHICFQSFQRLHKDEHLSAHIPAVKRGAVVLMSAADHYVEFFTEHGSHLRRMTMKAAVEKAKPADGMRVHRSHWVAYAAMLALEKDGERHILTLRNGLRVPVSPSNAAKVRNFLKMNSAKLAAE